MGHAAAKNARINLVLQRSDGKRQIVKSHERRGSYRQTVQKLALGMAKKKVYDVLDIRVKMEVVMAELEYGNLGFCPKLVSSVKMRFKEELAKMDKIEKIRFEIEFAEHWVFAW